MEPKLIETLEHECASLIIKLNDTVYTTMCCDMTIDERKKFIRTYEWHRDSIHDIETKTIEKTNELPNIPYIMKLINDSKLLTSPYDYADRFEFFKDLVSTMLKMVFCDYTLKRTNVKYYL